MSCQTSTLVHVLAGTEMRQSERDFDQSDSIIELLSDFEANNKLLRGWPVLYFLQSESHR